MAVKLYCNKNGPYQMEGKIEIFDAEGKKIPVHSKTIWLCRCGASKNKPFCDGSHRRVEFKG